MILQHGHPKSNTNGYVAEHILVMEKKIGRLLKDGEIVHHINGIREDNNPNNLHLFVNHSDHRKYHALLKKMTREIIQSDKNK